MFSFLRLRQSGGKPPQPNIYRKGENDGNKESSCEEGTGEKGCPQKSGKEKITESGFLKKAGATKRPCLIEHTEKQALKHHECFLI